MDDDYVVHMVIEGETGRDLSGYGSNSENEVLFGRRKKFGVTKLEFAADGTPTIYMTEVVTNGKIEQSGEDGAGDSGRRVPRGTGEGDPPGGNQPDLQPVREAGIRSEVQRAPERDTRPDPVQGTGVQEVPAEVTTEETSAPATIEEQEVILLPGTEIEVTSVTTANDGHPLIFAQEVAAHGVERNHGDAQPARSVEADRKEDRNGKPLAPGDGGQSGGVRNPTWDHNGRDGVLPERGESDPALTETDESAGAEEQIAEKDDPGNQEHSKGHNFVISTKGQKLPAITEARYKANANAIKTLRAIMADGRQANTAAVQAATRRTPSGPGSTQRSGGCG